MVGHLFFSLFFQPNTISTGHNFEGRPAGPPIDGDNTKSKTAKKILASQKQPPGPTLFFGNLSFQVTETSLQALLERNWKFHGIEKNDAKDDQNQNEKPLIRKVRLGTFEDSGKCKGLVNLLVLCARTDFISFIQMGFR